MLFIALMTATLGAAYLYEKTEKTCAELAIACVPVALISLVLSLIVAPWQIQLLILFTLLGWYRAKSSRLSI